MKCFDRSILLYDYDILNLMRDEIIFTGEAKSDSSAKITDESCVF